MENFNKKILNFIKILKYLVNFEKNFIIFFAVKFNVTQFLNNPKTFNIHHSHLFHSHAIN